MSSTLAPNGRPCPPWPVNTVNEVNAAAMTHQHPLRGMDALMDHQEAVDACVAQLLRPLIDEQPSVAFHDLMTTRA